MIWYLVGLIALIYLINKIVLFYGFHKLTYRMEINKRTAEIGEEIEIISLVENNKLLTVTFLKIIESFPSNFNITKNIYSLFIMPYQRVKRTYKVSISKRGLYIIDKVTLELGDFVGFKEKKINPNIENEILIFPKRIELEENILPIGSFNGDLSVKRWILDDPLMTIGVREYTGNEPERFIHWPSSLKYGNLMVRNFDFTSDNKAMILLNLETMEPSWKPAEEELIEKVISLTRAVMEEFEDSKVPYGFTCNENNNRLDSKKNNIFQAALGKNHHLNLLELLSRINYNIPLRFDNILKDIAKTKINYTTVVIITPRVLDYYVEWINLISKSINKLVVISLEEKNLNKLNNNIIKYGSR